MARLRGGWLGMLAVMAVIVVPDVVAHPPDPVDGADLTIAHRAMQAINRGNWKPPVLRRRRHPIRLLLSLWSGARCA